MTQFLLARFPATYLALRSVAVRLLFGNRTRQVRADARKVLFGVGERPRVKAGSFRGMLYDVGHTWGLPTNKWLGTYESELSSVIDEIISLQPRAIFDLGCAEGYYAVGLARLLPSTPVMAFDADPISLWQCRRLAQANGVAEQLTLRGYCSPELFGSLLKERSLVVCDIEGGEVEVLDLERSSLLRQCWLLIETHRLGAGSEWSGPCMRARFRSTHDVYEINQQPRSLASVAPDLVQKAGVSAIMNWLDEMRSPEQSWLWLKPKTF